MKGNRFLVLLLTGLGALLLFAVMAQPTIVHADKPTSTPENGTCFTCHEDLYLLHDTGNWYCLSKAPMPCVDCHGGDSSATTQEQAHTNRVAHPITQDDVSKCQECHPEECTERVRIFDQTAGISNVLVAIPYTPRIQTEQKTTAQLGHSASSPDWTPSWEFILLPLLSAAALIAFLMRKKRL